MGEEKDRTRETTTTKKKKKKGEPSSR